MTKKEIKLAKANGCINDFYSKEVGKLIRKRYTESEELAMLRHQTIDSERYASEWAEYNAYVEECKRSVKVALELE